MREMKRRFRNIILLWLSGAIFIFSAYAEKPFKIVSQSESEVLVKYLPQHYSMNRFSIEATDYFIPIGETNGLTNQVGKPGIPVEAFLFAIPSNTNLTIEILESKYDLLENINIAPVPTEIFDDEGNATYDYQKDQQFYQSETSFYPKELITVEEPFLFRDVFVSKVIFHPLQYSAALKTLKQFSHLVFRLKFTKTNESDVVWSPVVSGDKHFEDTYKSLILNYDQSKLFRVKRSDKQKDSEAIWWNPSQPYYRIPISADGIYRLSYTQLLNSGIDLQQIPHSTLSVYYKGNSNPIYLNTNDINPVNWYIDFYANRKYGDLSFFDMYTDTSHYWLTWNDINTKRIIDQHLITSPPVFSYSDYSRFQHFEQDLNYYYGYNDDETRTVTNVKGEGWYWLDFVGTTQKSINFSIDTVKSNRNGTAIFKARFHGMTAYSVTDTQKSRHRTQVRINGVLIGDSLWIQNEELIFQKNIPDSILKQGNNTLQISSIFVKLSKFYLDWFELTYDCPISVQNNYLDFNSPQPSTSEVTEFRVAKVTSDSIDIFDLTTNKKITSLNKSGNVWTFRDTLTLSKRYVIIANNQRSIPAAIIPHTFKNIRNNAIGADYIVITHSLFKNSAIQLANWRASHNNLRTVTIDVQDIYDEFNYGHLEPHSIKQFLKHTYDNWALPKPSFVAMFGDACTDFKKILTSTTKINYVPGWGIPMSDNALVCFDTVNTFFPMMVIGRIPVESPIQALRVATKFIKFDSPPRDEWRKKAMFVTGGNTTSEQNQFNALSNILINDYILPFPLGGQALKVYKSSSAIIYDGFRNLMQNHINGGLFFVNFIGHSGGRIWNVDIGSPNDLQNTNGKLPFISSVSCNIGAFYTTFSNVLSEDFLVADNRGGIAAWASSHIGSAQTGYWLAKKFLHASIKESVQTFGELTHLSRIYFWMINGYVITPTIIHTFNLYPLIGDPYSKIPLPAKPDFVIENNQIKIQPDVPISDNFISVQFIVNNIGLMPADSVLISLRDNYTDETGKFKGEYDIVPPFFWRPIAFSDTITIAWDVRGKPGSHILKVRIDPNNNIIEEDETNNSAEIPVYVHKSKIFVLKPNHFSIQPSGHVNLRVTVPAIFDSLKSFYSGGGDTILLPKQGINFANPYVFYFELDTTIAFNSPFKIISPQITPGQVFAEWTTPALQNEQTFFWRARTFNGKYFGAWVTASFRASDSAYLPGVVKWRQSGVGQFTMNIVNNLFVSDSGVTMQRSNGLPLYSRSVGYRAFPDSDYYSIIKIGELQVIGHWWQGANSYLAVSINPLTGNYQARGYTLTSIGQPDSLLRFLQNSPVGNYISLVVVQDGKSGITEALYQAIESLGATQIRSVTPGQSWSLITRKGSPFPMMTPLESYSPFGIAIVSYQMPNYYSSGAGSMETVPIGKASSWMNYFWNNLNPNKSSIITKLVGLKKDFTVDTLFNISSSQNSIDLSGINSSVFSSMQLITNLSNQDGEVTPYLYDWTITYSSVPELAFNTGGLSVKQIKSADRESLAVSFSINNLGDRGAGRTKIGFYIVPNIEIETTQFDSISAESEIFISKKIDVSSYYGNQFLKIRVEPDGWEDQITENNEIIIPFKNRWIDSQTSGITVTFDGRQIQKGDFVSSTPSIKIFLPNNLSIQDIRFIELDGTEVPIVQLNENTSSKIEFNPTLDDGDHNLKIVSKNNLIISDNEFKVLATPVILNVFNYPNPFDENTYFCFNLTGSAIPSIAKIFIYSVSGRKLKELIIPTPDIQIGFNRIEWDGKDNDGNILANGVYLYKIQTETDKLIQSSVQKLVKLR